MDIMDIADIIVEIGRQNMAEHGRIWQIAINYCRLRQSHNQSLITELVETGRHI